MAKGNRLDRAVRPEGEARYAAERGDVLILLADRLAEPVDLDMACLFGKFTRMHDASGMGMKARNSAVVKLPDEPSPVPAGISASVVISICGGPKSNSFRRFADDRMLDVFDGLDVLDLRVFEIDPRA